MLLDPGAGAPLPGRGIGAVHTQAGHQDQLPGCRVSGEGVLRRDDRQAALWSGAPAGTVPRPGSRLGLSAPLGAASGQHQPVALRVVGQQGLSEGRRRDRRVQLGPAAAVPAPGAGDGRAPVVAAIHEHRAAFRAVGHRRTLTRRRRAGGRGCDAAGRRCGLHACRDRPPARGHGNTQGESPNSQHSCSAEPPPRVTTPKGRPGPTPARAKSPRLNGLLRTCAPEHVEHRLPHVWRPRP